MSGPRTLAPAPEQLQKTLPHFRWTNLAAEEIQFDQHRNRFIAGRGALRAILGRFSGRGAGGAAF